MLSELKQRKKKTDSKYAFSDAEKELKSYASSTQNNFYSHGLEQIYAIEDVDVRTIKPMLKAKPIINKNKALHKKIQSLQPDQLQFDFGAPWRNWIEPLYGHQSIEVLSLSVQAQSYLHKLNIYLIKDLLQVNLKEFLFKGLGQGHVDEIHNKLQAYTDSHVSGQSRCVDFYSLIGAIANYIDKKEWAVLLSEYQLEHHLSLSSTDSAFLCYLSVAKKQVLLQQCLSNIKNNKALHDFVFQQLEKIVYAFICPWMQQRFGLSHKFELIDRLCIISEDHKDLLPLVQLLSNLFFSGDFILQRYLVSVEPEIFATNHFVANTYCRVVFIAKEYFYSTTAQYALDDLIYFVQRQLVQQWENIDRDFIRKILLSSASFRVHCNTNGTLLIQQ